MDKRTEEAVRALTDGPAEQRRALVELVLAARIGLRHLSKSEKAAPERAMRATAAAAILCVGREPDQAAAARLALLTARRAQPSTAQEQDTGTGCSRCGAAFTPQGHCTRRGDGCQGGRGERAPSGDMAGPEPRDP